MGLTASCPECKKIHRYDGDEIENLGTIWEPIFAVNCPNCGALIKKKIKKQTFINDSYISAEADGSVSIAVMNNKNGSNERVEQGDIREFWIQEYVKNNYRKLGFSSMKGPFDIGPDFRGIYKTKMTHVEVERSYRNYIEHGHPNDPRFSRVGVLIVLGSQKPEEKLRKKLPKEIIYIDVKHFINWWRPRVRLFAKEKRVAGLFAIIMGEFRGRYFRDYFQTCDKKSGDMALCPDCENCPYFDMDDAPSFSEMTIKFITTYEYPINSSDFNVTDIKASAINRFYRKYMLSGILLAN